MMGVYCRTHGLRFDEHMCDRRPRLVEDIRFMDPSPTWACVECGASGLPSPDHVCGQETRSEPVAGNPPTEPREAGRRPHSKPTHRAYVAYGADWGFRWTWWCRCEPLGDWPHPALSWAEAMAAALDHVREYHAPKESVLRLEPDVKDQLQAVLDRFRIPYREHHDDGRVAYKNYDPDPSSEAWRELIQTSREDC